MAGNRVLIDLEALRHNLLTVQRWMQDYGASCSVVTKALSGHEPTLRALYAMGVRSMADTRVLNLAALERSCPDAERWMIRPPHLAIVDEVVRLAQVSLVTEIVTLQALDRAAARQGKRHQVVLMLELGDLREGVVADQLNQVFAAACDLQHIDIAGLGSQMGCLSGAAPNADQVAQLLMVQDYLQLKFQRPLPLMSAGSTVFLHLLCKGELPPGVNHFRVGEALFLGSDLVVGGLLPELRDDVITLEAEISEIKRKSLVPTGETGAHTPFAKLDAQGQPLPPGARGYRALLAVGQLDTEVAGLTPIEPDFQVAGASSDIMVVNVGPEHRGLDVGDTIRFRCGYSAFVRLLAGRYVPIEVTPDLDAFLEQEKSRAPIAVPPCLGARA